MVNFVCVKNETDYIDENQYTFIDRQPVMLNYASQDFINKATDMYNATAKHDELFNIHLPIVSFINENNIDNINFDKISEALKKFMETDFERFTDLMKIAAVMLEEKDTKLLCDYIDDIVLMHINEMNINAEDKKDDNMEVQILHEESDQSYIDHEVEELTQDIVCDTNVSE